MTWCQSIISTAARAGLRWSNPRVRSQTKHTLSVALNDNCSRGATQFPNSFPPVDVNPSRSFTK